MNLDGPLAVFDLETTAADPEQARIVSAYLGVLRGDDVEPVWSGLVHPGVLIPPDSTAIHGITDADVLERGTAILTASTELEGALAALTARGVPVAAYNAAYDFTVLDREIERWHHRPLSFTPERVLDAFVLDKALEVFRKGSRTLTATSERWGVPLDGAHGAEADAVCAGRLAARLLLEDQFPPDCTLDDVHRWSRTWRARQQEGLRDYHRSIGKYVDEANYPLDWPLVPRRVPA